MPGLHFLHIVGNLLANAARHRRPINKCGRHKGLPFTQNLFFGDVLSLS